MEHSHLNETESLSGNYTAGKNTKKASGFTLFMDLLSGARSPDALWKNRMFRVKYAVRTLLHPLDTLKVLDKMATEPVWQDALSVQTKLPNKIHKPYLYLGLPSAGRADALVDHYEFVKNLTNASLKNALLSAGGYTVTQFAGKEGESFRVVLGSIGKSEREGEANMFLYMGETRLAALTFSVVQRPEGATIVVGGFQGANRSTPHEVIKQATKSCYGLFPKRLLLESLQRIAEQSGVKNILAVSDTGHVFRSLRYRHRKKNVFVASYNEFWDSISAAVYSPELYDVPLELPRKTMEEIPSKKRSEYRKRYTLLDELSESTASLLKA
ncbi:VirK/YbjX family protein [Rahnella sikkimica]|uniref:Virulence protein n=1 Tax=Rahnella sikkimica TaxID=1805933 RepID=A0A2L1UXI0_9GAMM|nr:VirK/YbjX family protein [Rahnella sikkimica]AVF37594.1 virulence protein [Rahnella sikkimica]